MRHLRGGLGPDEQLVVRLRSHPRVLMGPAFMLILLAAGFGIVIGQVPRNWGSAVSWVRIGLAAIFLVCVVIFVLSPALRWLTTSYTITTRRIMLRTGLVHRSGHDLPLNRISDVAFRRSLLDRLCGCGTIRLVTSSEQPLELPGVPEVADVQNVLAELIYASYATS
ncbi:PH domain-containing protein [Propionibacterium cyclohexanicum]|uniref:PH domain-containing protein n=1 Tax=Propionibacterium cyclohexanicum TaxID=64702 RepID=A0A1H9QGM6_9ACTN|nr:PH domain-containing protein [Propionibacterium cyclohexanicum]SER58999.1 PH domain-containing protein [Propionibacterium cyclohexanicum]